MSSPTRQGASNGSLPDDNNPVVQQPIQADVLLAPQLQQVARVAVRAPPFWKENPALWFRQLESQFFMNNIVSSETKYHIAVAALDTSVINQVSDVVMNPPAAALMYETLKNRLQERFTESSERRFKRLLNDIELGDKRPSHLWREMRELAENRVTDEFLLSLWLQRLPAQVQAILSNDVGDITRSLTMADRIIEVLNVRGDVQAVTSSPQTDAVTDTSDLQRLGAQINELTKKFAAFTSGDRRSRSRSISRNRGSPSYDQNRNGLCYYHRRFAAEARKCTKPCTFKSEN